MIQGTSLCFRKCVLGIGFSIFSVVIFLECFVICFFPEHECFLILVELILHMLVIFTYTVSDLTNLGKVFVNFWFFDY